MNPKQRRTLVLVAAVLAALVAVLFGVRACNARQAAEEEAAAQAEQKGDTVPTNSDTFTSIAYDNGTTNLSFARDEAGKWIWADDPEFPLDGSYLDQLSYVITNLDPMQTITDGDTLEAYGLETPSGTVTATAENGAVTTLLLGKALSDGSYYLKTAEADTVYVVSASLHERISMGVYEMALLEEFPALTEENMRTVTISGAQITALSVSKGEDDEHGTWTLGGGEDVSGQADVATLSAELSALAFASCEDYHPSDKAVEVCGFGAPAATVVVEYVTEEGADASMTLVVAGETTDGAGRYARLNDSATIYSLANEGISVLLDIAQNGMTAS